MVRKAAQTSAAPTTETHSDAQTTAQTGTDATTETPTGTAKTRAPKKSAKVLFEAAIEKIKTALGELVTPRYASAGEEFRKCIEDAKPLLEAAHGLMRGLPDDWKPAGKGARKRKGFANGEFVKAKEKYIELFRERGFGAGPFKVLGFLPNAGEVKLVVADGSQYVPAVQVERVTMPAATTETVPANE
jgi:hypothetical protein